MAWTVEMLDPRKAKLTWTSSGTPAKTFAIIREAAAGSSWGAAERTAAIASAIAARDEWATYLATKSTRESNITTAVNTADTNPPTVN